MKKYIIIIALAAILLAFYFLFFHDSKPKSTAQQQDTKTEAKYNIDLVVWFINSEGDTLSKLYVEVADDYYSQARGLMYRPSMPDTVGMLFIYDDNDFRSFWMKNTHISLDLIFISNKLKINQIHEYAIPYSEESIVSKDKAKYVIEVNAGYTDKLKITAGQSIILNLK